MGRRPPVLAQRLLDHVAQGDQLFGGAPRHLAAIREADLHCPRDAAQQRIVDLRQIVDVFAHHGGDQLHARQIRNGVFSNQLAVAQHGDPIADLINLLQKMGDEDDSNALVAQPAHQGE